MLKMDENNIATKLIELTIQHAREGSKLDALYLLKNVLKNLENNKPLPEPLKDYFNSALRTIIKGTDPNRAFLLVGIQGSDKGGIHKRYEIARLYRIYKKSGYSTEEIINEFKSSGHEIKLRRAQEIHMEFKEILDIEEDSDSFPSRQKRTKKVGSPA